MTNRAEDVMQHVGEALMSGPAVGILKARYARGEIDKDPYERMRRDLER